MNVLKLLLLASLSFVFPILLGFAQMMIVLSLQAILGHYGLEAVSYFVPFCVEFIYLVCIWLFLNCEFNFSQSTIPLKIQQLVRCTYDNGKLTKQRVFGFANTIDSARIIEFFGKRAILQSKIQNAQNCKINNKEAE